MPPTAHEDDSELGTIIAILRTRRRWNQKQLAYEAKVSRSSLSAYEQGTIVPDLKTLTRIVRTLGFQLSAIDQTRAYMRWTDNPEGGAEILPSLRCAQVSRPPRELEALAAEGRRAFDELFHRAVSMIEECNKGGVRATSEPGDPCADLAASQVLLQELVNAPTKRRRSLVLHDPRFLDWKLAVLLADQSLSAARKKPDLAVEFAELGLLVIDRAITDPAQAAKIRWYLWAHLANAQRAAGNHLEADQSFRRAEGFPVLETGFVCGLMEEARPPAMLASLRLSQHRLDECMELLTASLGKNPSRALRTSILINKARALRDLERFEEAHAMLDAAEVNIDARKDSHLLYCARQNRVFLLTRMERYAEARDLLPTVKCLSPPSALERIRLIWIEGTIVAALGNIDRGIELLSAVRAELASRGIGYDTALVSLELAGLYAKQENTEAVKAVSGNLATIFKANAVHREALAAIAIFRQAADRGEVTAGLTQKIVAYLSRARHNPDLRFE